MRAVISRAVVSRAVVSSAVAPIALATLSLLGCGAEQGKCVAYAPPPPPTVEQMRAAPLPAKGTWRMVIVVDRATPPETFYGLYYGAVASGWRVSVAGAAGSDFPVDRAIDAVKPGDFDFLVLPSDVPVRALIQAFPRVAAVGQGARWIAEAGSQISPTQNQRVARMQAKMQVKTPGEIPALLHRMSMYAEDQLRVEHKATGGHPP